MASYMRLLLISSCLVLAGSSMPAGAAEKKDTEKKEQAKKDEKTDEKKEVKKEEPKKEEKKEEKDEAKIGLDTLDIQDPEGNWLFKRIWFEKGQLLFEEIKVATDQAVDQRMAFFAKRTELDKAIFDPFYIETGFGRGELEEIIHSLTTMVEEQRKELGTLTEEERAFHETLLKSKEQLKQLQMDIEAIGKLDNSVDEALVKLIEQLNLCRTYERQSWENLKGISQELSDKRAKGLYYAMMTHKENIVAISNYIKKDFNAYFEKLAKTAKEQVDRVKSEIKSVKEKGVDFKKQVGKLEERGRKVERERIKKERNEAVEEAVEQTREEMSWSVRLQSWWGSFAGVIKSAWSAVTDKAHAAYRWAKGLFVKSESVEAAPALPEVPTPPAPKAGKEPVAESSAQGAPKPAVSGAETSEPTE